MVVVLPKRRPEEGGADTGDGLDLIVAGVDIGDDLIGGEGVEVGVVVGVAHDLVAGVGQGLHRLGVFIHPLSHHEEGGLDVVLVKDVDEVLGVLVAPGECYHTVLAPQGIEGAGTVCVSAVVRISEPMTDRIRTERMGSISNAGHLAAAKKVWRGIDLCLNIYYYNREGL